MGIDPARILFCDDHLLAVHKLSGELVVRGRGAVGRLPLLDFLRRQYPGLRAVHRLDFETSGVVLFARNATALRAILSKKFDRWGKMYLTIVKGVPRREGIIRVALPQRSSRYQARNPKHEIRNKSEARNPKKAPISHSAIDADSLVPATTKYRVVEALSDCALVEAVMVTGRYHQLRRHFAAIGHPLALDDVYGDRAFNQQFTREYGYHRFFLHAAQLAFPHPMTGEMVHIEAPLPRAFAACLERLRCT